mmetsp:Transcript_10704/g.19377  ORF Transcript_10704/g.19377 Transcript_10704/m.19377 type:complete len:91 (-) Transcript_10704:194-466(-)
MLTQLDSDLPPSIISECWAREEGKQGEFLPQRPASSRPQPIERRDTVLLRVLVFVFFLTRHLRQVAHRSPLLLAGAQIAAVLKRAFRRFT